ncbi:MAG: ATP-dependent helicase HrpB, partial [Bacteroidia bacterium]|nr:ATP-dependent helicase HrpB [Bacteroidia bacterium]
MIKTYPIVDVIPELKEKFLVKPILILQAPPGAGKSTILPLQLMDEPWLVGKKILMLEPRRLAARSVAIRMSHLLKEEVGTSVGYRVRFESIVSARTRIEVVTEGILTRMIQTNNSLDDVGLVIFDEFHERSLQADLALAFCLQVQETLRDDLRILIMSATLNGEEFSTVLKNSAILSSTGRQYPVVLKYIQRDKDEKLTMSVARCIRKAINEQQGDILAFLPGAGEIMRVTELLDKENLSISLHPLYGDLPFTRQQEAILPHPQGKRKVVLATSIAETSLTIEGITTVVDGGYSRVPRFNPRSGLTHLETIRVTKDAADQRAGRAGRLGPGVCYRLWPETTHHMLQPVRQPEILEADLAPLILELANWGVQNVNDLTWINSPPAGAINQGKELLHQLDVLQNNIITAKGKAIVKLPTHPRIAHMLLSAASSKTGEVALATDIAALLEERDPLVKGSGADLSLRVEVLRKWRRGERITAEKNILERIERVASSWRKIFKIQADNSTVIDSDVGRFLAEAYPERIARQAEKHSSKYKLANGRVVRLPDHDALVRDRWLVAAQLDSGGGEGKIYLAAPILEEDLIPLAKEFESIRWNVEKGMIEASLEKRIGNVVLSSKPLTKISESVRAKILCDALREEGLKLLNWSELQAEWQSRVMSLRTWRPDEDWPDVSDTKLLATAEEWLSPYLINVSKRIEFTRLEIQNILTGILTWEQSNRLDKLAPHRLPVPSGSMIKLSYFMDGRQPIMEVRLQELFGLLETPTINERRNKILLHLLSPGYKPVQVTQDLKSFWHTIYHEVRSELRRRYPKHSWPEDPWTAEAVRGAVR